LLGFLEVCGDERRHSRSAAVDVGAPEFVGVDRDAGELLDHRRAGDEGVGVLHHDHDVGESEHERRAGHCRPRDDHDHRNDARAAGHLAGGAAPTVERSDPHLEIGAARSETDDEGEALVECVARSGGDGVAVARGERTGEVLSLGVDDHHSAAVEVRG